MLDKTAAASPEGESCDSPVLLNKIAPGQEDKAGKTVAGSTEGESCDSPVLLDKIAPGKEDKLGNTIKEVLWRGANYAIYCSDKGIYVHFSDCKKQEEEQRARFTKICPELCELRYLTTQMRGWNLWSSLFRDHRHTLYEHNMAQALMLIMENKQPQAEGMEQATKLAQQTLAMAVRRVTNDNTIRYVRACFASGAGFILAGAWMLWWLNGLSGSPDVPKWSPYVVAGMFGAVGAVFSIVTRVQAFELRPCDESRMNYLMGLVRVLLGVMSAIALLLFAHTVFADMAKKLGLAATAQEGLWEAVAVFGFVGGFAERLIPNILRQTIDKMETSAGTPVQAIRAKESESKAGKNNSAAPLPAIQPAE